MTARHELPTPGPAAQIAAMFSALVPTIVTDRLVLRGPRLSDFPVFADILCSERGRFVGGPMARDAAWTDFAGIAANWMLHGHGGWTIEDAATLDVLGFVVLGLEPGDREVELGFLLRDAAEAKGIAHEAALAVRDWAVRDLNLTGLVSYVDPDNARSIRLAERMGAVRDLSAEAVFDEPVFVYRHPRGGSA